MKLWVSKHAKKHKPIWTMVMDVAMVDRGGARRTLRVDHIHGFAFQNEKPAQSAGAAAGGEDDAAFVEASRFLTEFSTVGWVHIGAAHIGRLQKHIKIVLARRGARPHERPAGQGEGEPAGWQWRNSREDFWHFAAKEDRAAWEASLYKFGEYRALYAAPPSAPAAPPAPASRATSAPAQDAVVVKKAPPTEESERLSGNTRAAEFSEVADKLKRPFADSKELQNDGDPIKDAALPSHMRPKQQKPTPKEWSRTRGDSSGGGLGFGELDGSRHRV